MSFMDRLRGMMGSNKGRKEDQATHNEPKTPQDYNDERRNSENSI